jgi:DNA-binding NarL/FixJ family response regulator
LATTIWILVVDDYEAWRRFIATTLGKLPQTRVIGEAFDGPSAVLSAQQLRPDLIVLDIGLPGLNGIEVARRIRELRLNSKILFLTENRSQEVVEEALRAGGNGYLVKTDAARELLLAVEAVLQDKQFMSSSLLKNHLTDPSDQHGSDNDGGVPSSSERAEAERRHDVGFYFDDRNFLDDLTRFIGTALNAGNAAVVVATEAHREGLLPRLQAHGVDIFKAIEQRRYMALDAAAIVSSLTVNKHLDRERFLEVASNLILTAAGTSQNQNPRVAICGECEPPLWTFGNGEAAIEFEKLWNEILKRYDVDILCGYSFGTVQNFMNRQLFQRICALHSAVHGSSEGF